MSKWPEIGVHHGVSFDEYRAFTGAVNWHTLWRLREESPAHALYEMTHGTKETEAMAFGSLTDFVLLEPGRFEAEAVVEPEIGSKFDDKIVPKRPTKAQLNAKSPSESSVASIEFWQAWDAANAGKIKVKAAEYARVLEIERSVRSAQCREYILGGRSQVCIVWVDPGTGLLCKGRLDYERYAGLSHYLTDLKTAKSAKKEPFQSQIFRYGYDGQYAFYHDGWAILNDGESSVFTWLAAEKEGLCVVKPWQAHEDWLDGGRNLYRPALNQWAECVRANEWPSYGDTEILEMPGWAKERRGVGPDLIRPEPQYTGGGVPEGEEPDEFDTFIEGEQT